MSLDQERLAPPEGYHTINCPNPAENDTLTSLERHARASQHETQWRCFDDDCEKIGEVFETSALYIKHIEESSGHRGRDEDEDVVDTECSAFTPSDNTGQQSVEDDVFGPSLQSVTSVLNICDEPCCRHFGTDYKCKSEYIRHADTSFHQLAANWNKILASNISSALAIEAEQQAIRALRCTSPHCSMFGQVLKTPKVFYKHLSEDEHREGWSVKFEDEDLNYKLDKVDFPGIEFYAGGRKGICVNEKCPKFGARFDSYHGMKLHSRSFGHAMTEEDLASTEESGEEVWKKSDIHGMDFAEDETLWKCVKRGCKGFDKVIYMVHNARKHFNSDAHLMAEQEVSSPDEPHEALEGVEFSKEKGRWICVKPGCKGFDKAFSHTGVAVHNRSIAHVTAKEKIAAPTQPTMNLFTTPKRVSLNPLLTPIEVSGSTIHVSPGSPSAGRGHTLVRRPATDLRKSTTPSTRTPATIKLRRSSASKAGMEKRQVGLEKRNQDLEDRVAKLEEQMGRVLGAQSPQVPQTPEARAARVESLSKFVRASFRPALLMDEDEPMDGDLDEL
ncbi:hypothetical protein FSARC_2057 [Fusarium sarcochroum]|uniref:Uncharacterized protein n=1 Tax=Fusarium sarcochroum TaxID=1208366 RepID=A0A8H4XEC8_9HYPO|nr:hypothetical protein FSARC_2057 [Fusarium sarcochroum]